MDEQKKIEKLLDARGQVGVRWIAAGAVGAPAVFFAILLPLAAEAATDVSGLWVVGGSTVTWNAAGSPYLVKTGGIRLEGALAIGPGVVVKIWPGWNIRATSGSLSAEGTAGSPVVFTSYRDDEHGGDGNEDGPSAGAAGDWIGIQVSNSVCTLRHTLVRFAGSPDTGNNWNGILANGAGTSLTVEDSTVEKTAGNGIAIGTATSVAISRTAVRENDFHGIYLGGGASAVLDGCAIRENDLDGVRIQGSTCELRSNEIGGNRYALSFEGWIVLAHDGANRIDGNANDRSIVFLGNRFLSGTLPGPASLPPPLSGYLFANSPEVSAGKELSIEPGTVLKFSAGVAMAVKGTLTASGTAESPIVFTSHRDDEHGGDGNDDGPSAGAPGDWVGIQVAAAACTLRHTLVRFAGCPDTGNNRNGILAYGAGTSLAVEDSTVELTAGIGVAIGSKASAAISRTAVRENDSHGIYVGGGASVVLDGCAIQENVFDGIHIENAACDLRSNEIGGNRYALSFEEGLQVSHDGGNRIEGNESDAAVAFVGDRFLSGTLPGPASLPPPLGCYLFTVSPEVTTGNTLTIEPGTILKFGRGISLVVNGSLMAAGTPESPIVFTSYRDDEHGGDADGDGPSSGQPGDWDMVAVVSYTNDADSEVEGTLFRFGGSGGYGVLRTALHSTLPDGTVVALRKSTIQDSSSSGASASNRTLQLSEVTISGCAGDAISIVNHSHATIEGCQLLENAAGGIYLEDSEAILTATAISGSSCALAFGFGVAFRDGGGNRIEGNASDRIVELRGQYLEGSLPGIDELPDPLDTYVVQYGYGMSVRAGTSLAIGPGVVLKFPSGLAQLYVEGTLGVAGLPERPVVFTSLADDEHNGDTNGDGPSSGAPGGWAGIRLKSGVRADLLAAHVLYGDYGIVSSGATAGLTGCSVRSSRNDGIYAAGGGLTLNGSEVVGSLGCGIRLDGCPASISGSALGNNGGAGIRAKGSAFHISRSTIAGNNYPIWLEGRVEFTHELNAIAGNVHDRAILINTDAIDGTLYGPRNLPPPIAAYAVEAGFKVSAGKTLTVEPGAILKVRGAQIIVEGTLTAEGTAGEGIVFTSHRDDEHGGDTNADGASAGSPGDWIGIVFGSTSTGSVLRHADIRYGGSWGCGTYTSICFAGGGLIESCLISRSQQYGIFCWSGAPIIRNSRITGNLVGIACQNGALPVIGGAAGLGNTIAGNTEYGVRNFDPAVTIDARFNYWGAATGPLDPSAGPPLHNPGGGGDRVSDYVDYSSWAAEGADAVVPLTGPDLWMDLRGDVAASPGAPFSYQLWYGNLADAAAAGAAVRLELPPGITYREDTSGLTPGVSEDSRTITWQMGSIAPRESVAFFVLADSTPDVAGTLTARAEVSSLDEDRAPDDNSSAWDTPVEPPQARLWASVYAEPLRPGFESTYTVFYANLGTATAYDARIVFILDRSTFEDGTRRCAFVSAEVDDPAADWDHDASSDTLTFFLGDIPPGGARTSAGPGGGLDILLPPLLNPMGAPFPNPYGGFIVATVRWILGVDQRNHPCSSMGHVVGCYQRSASAEATLDMAGVPWTVDGHVTGSADPNDKQVSPQGYLEGRRFIRGDTLLSYSIHFENKPEATAEATFVWISDPIDPDLEWSTVQVSAILVGGKLYAPHEYDRGKLSISLDPATGRLRIFFDGIDLPPNRTPPEGEGLVLFTVAPKKGLPDGTEIRNRATIVFDYNPPIDTPETVNTIDSTPPDTGVLPLPAVLEEKSFEVRWEGADALSGLAWYTVYVSADGAQPEIWIDWTQETSATFTGEFGHTYSFSTIGWDHIWNREALPGVPDATVSLQARGIGPFLRGECTGDGKVDISDPIAILDYLFVSGSRPGCLAAANSNGDKGIDITDPIRLLEFLFLGGAAPEAPFPGCGMGSLPADGVLGCEGTACP